ncbi:MAG: COX15/CtaA family protein [Acidobacteriota bacterium]|nr:COX15/CtaA family protein [Acidobacteriota bacterium]
MRWLHRFAWFLAASTLLLIVAGGMVTSTDSGLAVPDWPNTYGQFMFTFPMKNMVGGIFYEHGHRLIASTVGFLTIILAIWLWRADERRWMRRLGVIALAAVILQGVLGGITVLYFLPAPVSVAHAGLAEIFFCLTVAIAVFTSARWRTPIDADPGAANAAPVNDPTLRRITTITTALVYVQILLGATMRHTGAGLAIPDFPLAFGRLVPHVWNFGIAIHYAHRVGALVVTIAILAVAGHVFYHHRGRRELTRPAALLTLLLVSQVTLGALVVLSGRQEIINTAHVANGALVLVTSLVLTLNSSRLNFSGWSPALQKQTGKIQPGRIK